MVTNLKAATCKFGDPLAECNYNFMKVEAAQTIMTRESMSPATYPYPAVDREGKFVDGSLEFERVSNLKSATLTLGGSAIGHVAQKFEITENVMWRESMSPASYPYVSRDIEGKYCEGSLEFELVDGTAYPNPDVDSVALACTLTGFSFSGNVRLSNFKLSCSTEPGSKATISFDFRTIDGTYTWTLTTSGLPSIHDTSVPMEVVGSGIYFSGNVILDKQKVSASVEVGSKATITMDFKTIDGDYEFSEVAA